MLTPQTAERLVAQGSRCIDAEAAYAFRLVALEITIDIDRDPPVLELPLKQRPESLHLLGTERGRVNREMLGLIGPSIPGEVHEAVGSLVAVHDSHDVTNSTVESPIRLAIGVLGSLGWELYLNGLVLNEAFIRFS
jgi:hypothetical protein